VERRYIELVGGEENASDDDVADGDLIGAQPEALPHRDPLVRIYMHNYENLQQDTN